MILGIPPETPEMLWRTNRWFIENNITNWHWNVLQVSRDVSGPWVSEFDRESEKYGIDWVVRNGVNIWKTKYQLTAKDGSKVDKNIDDTQTETAVVKKKKKKEESEDHEDDEKDNKREDDDKDKK